MAKRSGSKNIVDTWIYRYKGVSENADPQFDADDDAPAKRLVEERDVEIQIELIKQFDDTVPPPFPTRGVSFRALNRELSIYIEGVDIEAIRKAVWSILDKKYEIKWENWYLVEIEPTLGYRGGRSEGLEFVYRHVEKGIAWDGAELLREYDRHGDGRGNHFKISPWPGVFKNSRGKIVACIPETKANTAALEEFAAQITKMRERLGAFFEPEHIQSTLANLSGLRLLGNVDKEEVD
jgi:hypothetical protein